MPDLELGVSDVTDDRRSRALTVFEMPSRLYMMTETDITKTYGIPSTK